MSTPPIAHWGERNATLIRRFARGRRAVLAKITPQDKDLYQHFFEVDHRLACYGNSWSYITQACRGFGLGLKYHDRDVLLSIGCHKDHYVIVRPLGPIDDRIMKVIRTLHSISGKPVFIKKVYPDQLRLLRQLGDFRETAFSLPTGEVVRGEYPWGSTAFADDDTYPEIVLDLRITLNFAIPPRIWMATFNDARRVITDEESLRKLCIKYLKFRGKTNSYLRAKVKCYFSAYESRMATDIREFLAGHFGEADRTNTEAYENMLTQPPVAYSGSPPFKFVAYAVGEPDPVGFFVAERLDANSAGLYAAIASRRHAGLSEYLHLEMFRRLQAAGVSLLNIGGSEIRSLHEFKSKFAPVEERRLALLAYGHE